MKQRARKLYFATFPSAYIFDDSKKKTNARIPKKMHLLDLPPIILSLRTPPFNFIFGVFSPQYFGSFLSKLLKRLYHAFNVMSTKYYLVLIKKKKSIMPLKIYYTFIYWSKFTKLFFILC